MSARRSPSPPALEHAPSTFDNLDDVFGSAPSSPNTTAAPQNEPSEISRLQSEHSTAGYRDGLTAGKALHIQTGFDEGYALSTVIGLRVGVILGVLEGLYTFALKKSKSANSAEDTEEVDRLKSLFKSAKTELSTEAVFAREFWDEDGIWKFAVANADDEEGEVLFEHVADAHPLLKKWKAIMEKQVEDCGLRIGPLDEQTVLDE